MTHPLFQIYLCKNLKCVNFYDFVAIVTLPFSLKCFNSPKTFILPDIY